MEYKDPGRYIPTIYILYSWGSLFGVPSRVSLTLLEKQAGPAKLSSSSRWPFTWLRGNSKLGFHDPDPIKDAKRLNLPMIP